MQCATFSIVRRRFINRRSVHGSESLDNEELVLLLLVSLISTPADAVLWTADLTVRCPNGQNATSRLL
jgi:hypothetical protein